MLNQRAIRRIGKGTYSNVYSVGSARDEQEGDLVLKRNFTDGQISWSNNIKELDMLARLRGHPFIISLEFVCFGNPFPDYPLSPCREAKDDNLHFFLERMLSSSRQLFCETNTSEGYYVQVNILATQLLLAVEFIHSQEIIHRDIKPDNILLGQRDEKDLKTDECGIFLRLSDFGLSKNVCPTVPSTPGTVSGWYRAPEISMGLEYGEPSDMWSVGCVLFEMVAGRPLLSKASGDGDQVIYQEILSILPRSASEEYLAKAWNMSSLSQPFPRGRENGRRMSFQEQANLSPQDMIWFNETSNSSQYFDVVNGLLEFDPSKRWTAKRALDSPYFEDMREYIKAVRTVCPPKGREVTVKILKSPERKWMANIVAGIVNHPEKHRHLTDQMIFQAISIFDRYISWMEQTQDKNSALSQTVGWFHSSKELSLRFQTILYLSYKYFLSRDSLRISWTDFHPEGLAGSDNEERAKAFEIKLLEQILKYHIFEQTPFEHLAKKYVIDHENALILIQKYITIEEWDGPMSGLVLTLLG